MRGIILDRQSFVPLYHLVQEHLLDQVRSGALKAGGAVPSEGQIAASLDISRMTARQALKSLCHMGVLYSHRGKGTFVARPKLERTSASCCHSVRRCGREDRSQVRGAFIQAREA